jgi:hypothetical protein
MVGMRSGNNMSEYLSSTMKKDPNSHPDPTKRFRSCFHHRKVTLSDLTKVGKQQEIGGDKDGEDSLIWIWIS